MCSLNRSEYSNLKQEEATMGSQLGSSEGLIEMNENGLKYTCAWKQHPESV
jgi:hypothetical protein